MKKNRDFKLRALLLTTVSGIVLLSGCQTYKNMRATVLHERPEQDVENNRRMPVLNQGMAGRPQNAGAYALPPQMAAPAQPQQQAPQQAAAKPQGGSTPFDMYDESGNAVEPSDMPAAPAPVPAAAPAPAPAAMGAPQPRQPEMVAAPERRSNPTQQVVTANDAHFVSNNNMNPPATGANEKDSGNFFDRLFGGKKEQTVYARKPIPGNPQYDSATNVVAPVPQGPLSEQPVAKDAHFEAVARDAHLEPQQAEPVQLDAQPMPAPERPLLDSPMQANRSSSAYDAEMNDVDASQGGPVTAASPSRSMPVPQGAIPLVEAMPVDEDDAPRQAVPMAPSSSRETVTEPLANVESNTEQTQMVEDTQPAAPEPIQLAQAQTTAQPQEQMAASEPQQGTSEDEMFMPVTNFQEKEEEGHVVTVSSLADKKPEEKNWFERNFSSDKKSADKAAKDDRPNWFERNFGEKAKKPEAQTKEYPSFSAVPPTPKQFDEVQATSQQDMREMESMRDQAQEAKMELTSEPSGTSMTVAPQQAEMPAAPANEAVSATAPEAPQQPQLLGQMSAPVQYDGGEGAPVAAASPPAPLAMPAAQPRGESLPAPAMAAEEKPVLPQPPASAPQVSETKVAPQPARMGLASPTPLVAPMNMDDHAEMKAPASMPAPMPAAEAIGPVSEEMPDNAPASQPTPQVVETITSPQPAPAMEQIPEPVAAEAAPAPQPEPVPEAPAPVMAEPVVPAAPEAPASAQAAAAPAEPAAAPAATSGSSALPSPALLQKVKVLPPSRYENRRQAQ